MRSGETVVEAQRRVSMKRGLGPANITNNTGADEGDRRHKMIELGDIELQATPSRFSKLADPAEDKAGYDSSSRGEV